MKKVIISGVIVIMLGLLIALGPQFLFKTCDPNMSSSANADADDCCAEPAQNNCCGPAASSLPICYWSARAEIGIGFLIAALGACMFVFTDPKTHLGLLIGILLASIITLAVPHFLIGGCGMMTMRCRRVAFPAITIESAILLIFTAVMITVIAIRKPKEVT